MSETDKGSQLKGSPWNSLEVAKVVASTFTPLVVLILGILFNGSLKDTDRSMALRSEIYKNVGGDLNDIYCYLSFVGGWKELTPPDVIARKRAVDKAMFTYRPFFTAELLSTYERFMGEAFRPFGGPGADARIRSDIETPDGDRRIHGNKWEPNWEERFTKERNKDAQRDAYTAFLSQMARDLKL